MKKQLGKLSYLNTHFFLRAIDKINLPYFIGSTLRWGFGYAFKEIVCSISIKDCSKCPIASNCAYYYVYETPCPPDAQMMRLYPNVPHPFVIDSHLLIKNEYVPEELFDINLLLIGKAINYLPYFILTFEVLGKKGIGRSKGKFGIDRIMTILSGKKPKEEIIYSCDKKILIKPSCISDFPLQSLYILENGKAYESQFLKKNKNKVNSITLEFLTPTLIIHYGNEVRVPHFHQLIRNILRRLSALSYFHCDQNLNHINYKKIIKKSEQVKLVETNVKWFQTTRYSKRQQQSHILSGFTGTVTYEGNFIQDFIPLLELFSHLHIGKHTSFSQGKYIIKEITFGK